MHGDGPFVVRMAAWGDEWIPTDDIKMVNWHWIASIGTIALTSIFIGNHTIFARSAVYPYFH